MSAAVAGAPPERAAPEQERPKPETPKPGIPGQGVHVIGGGAMSLDKEATLALLGGKAYNLAQMAALGLTVPPAFVIDTRWCARAGQVTPELWEQALARLEEATGLRLGDARRPLLLSVRSGAPVSMPGMMETLLNIGLTDATLPGVIRVTGNPRLAWDSYRRLIASYGEVVMGVEPRHFDDDLDAVRGDVAERELDFAALRDLARRHLATVRREAGAAFPQSVDTQLREAVLAVFRSWDSDKARRYREIHSISGDIGTAVTVQRMVFGNAGGLSGAGVGFTRDPGDGTPAPWVDFLFNAQGEDVVSGRRSARGHDELAAAAPAIWDELVGVTKTLERHFRDMEDFEFTVQDGRLFMLQTRTGKRTRLAAARIALDMHDEGLIDRPAALERTEGLDAATLAIRSVVATDGHPLTPIASAATASAGVACGEIALDEARARARKAAGVPVILVRQDAETRDIVALDLAEGLLTRRGARTSHAAVVARQLGKVCLVGCEALAIDEAARAIRIGAADYREGDMLTLDGNGGQVYAGVVQVREEAPEGLLARLALLRKTGLD